jgi:DNA-binding transcriptional MerR regulator
MATTKPPDKQSAPAGSAGGEESRPQKGMTIGVVCKGLAQEFPDISISKIRYLEDQKLLNPRRTAGGYRLYSPSDMVRLRTILRLQRDEFLPLRVIRQELASGRASDGDGKVGTPEGTQSAVASKRKRRASVSVTDAGAMYALEDVLEETRADPALVRELEDYGVIKGELRAGKHYYDETEREIIGAVTELARYGVGGRNLRVFRSSADREAALLQQILAPALRSRNPERRKEALEALENLAAVATHLKHLLLIRDLRKIAG